MHLFVRFLLPVCFLCLLAACHRPVAYLQRTSHAPASRLPLDQPTMATDTSPDFPVDVSAPISTPIVVHEPATASLRQQPVGRAVDAQITRRMNRVQSLLSTSIETSIVDKQPRPKPKPQQKLRLGNQIREKLGVPLRKELNWWQKISWKLKASVIIILVAVLFAILNITILAIIFGVLGAFLLITGLKKSMKVRRPWF